MHEGRWHNCRFGYSWGVAGQNIMMELHLEDGHRMNVFTG
jgi:hypothetical protein